MNPPSRHWRTVKGKATLLSVAPMLFLCAPVAQLDRALASGARGREFESPWARHLIPTATIIYATFLTALFWCIFGTFGTTETFDAGRTNP